MTPEQEFALFRKGALLESEQALKQARVLRYIAWAMAAGLAVLITVAGFYLVRFMKMAKKPSQPAIPFPLPKRL
jgi:hypothetical protein